MDRKEFVKKVVAVITIATVRIPQAKAISVAVDIDQPIKYLSLWAGQQEISGTGYSRCGILSNTVTFPTATSRWGKVDGFNVHIDGQDVFNSPEPMDPAQIEDGDQATISIKVEA